MNVSRTLPDNKTVFSFEAPTPKDVFVKLALIDDLFNEGECGCCHSKAIRFVQRKVDNGFYLEMRCADCGAQLDYGQNKEGGGIFVKKWDKENQRPMPNGGWHVYHRTSDQGSEPPAQQQRKANVPPPSQDDEAPF